MNNWKNRALTLLKESLDPVPSELNELDWKNGLSNKTDRLAQHLTAFSNLNKGGFMVFGVNDNGDCVGVDQTKVSDIVQTLGNIARNNVEPKVAIEHSVENYNDVPILIVYIIEQKDKPTHLRGKDIFESYKRSGGSTVKMSQQEVKILLSQSKGVNFEEEAALDELNDDEVLNLLEYDNFFRMVGRNLPDTKKGIIEILSNEGLILRRSDSLMITNLGAILFARNLDNFKNLKRKSVRVIVYEGTSRIKALKEQVGVKGYATGFEGLIKYIMDQLPSNEIIEAALRKQVKVYPEVAIREFVANALIHQDLYVQGSGVMIEIFSDRIEISNPGIPLIETNRFIDHAPRSRNEVLASLMRRLNICEERGSGVDRAITAIEEYQLPAPKFLKGQEYTRVIVYSLIPLSKMNNEDRIRACYQHTCLHYINNQVVNNQSIRRRFSIAKNNISFASKIITETVESKLIKPSDPENGSKKFATYIPYWA